MMVEAKPLDVDHRVDEDTIDDLLLEIVEHPPELPREKVFYGEASAIVAAPEESDTQPD